ncbi:hypothetical protein D6858_13220 [Tsuneonella suprasediminis]|uniref:Uncharacterized protein n=1 Tax=Tsuneonella suprasediminis TaxID=2306996 RepID=A0A419QYX0_9SPHN|nr:hypothetical protein D6858_13220 [Tsuneonella suprasediminis]
MGMERAMAAHSPDLWRAGAVGKRVRGWEAPSATHARRLRSSGHHRPAFCNVAPDLIRGPAPLPARHWQKLDPGSKAGVTEPVRRREGVGKNVASPHLAIRHREKPQATWQSKDRPFASITAEVMGSILTPWIASLRSQ